MDQKKAKLIALDIDGTIIDKEYDVPLHPDVREAVAEARAAGVKVCLCSARPCYFMDDATDGLGEIDALIGCNGATIETDGKLIYKETLPLPLLLACLDTAKRLDVYLSFAGDEKIYVCIRGPVAVPLELGDRFVTLGDEDTARLLREQDLASSFIFTKEPMARDAVFTGPGFELADIHKSSGHSFTVTNKGTNKGTGLARLAAHWGIPLEQALAVGNDGNDIPMLEAAGTGVAVANASPEVIAAAEYIVPSVSEGGAAEAIRRFAL